MAATLEAGLAHLPVVRSACVQLSLQESQWLGRVVARKTLAHLSAAQAVIDDAT